MTIPPGGVCAPGSTIVNKPGGWRTFKPVYDHDKCLGNKCGKCELLCPDASVDPDESIPIPEEKKSKIQFFFKFNYDFCKGCGICANECPNGAIEMILEEK